MRRAIAILMITCLATISSSAQVFNTGLIAGLSGSQVEGDGYGGYHKLGFIGGGFVNTDISEKWSTQFEIYFINKGSFKGAQPDKGDYDRFDLNINYIEIPLALRYHYHKFMFEAGVYYSKFLNAQVEDEFGPVSITRFPFKSYDLGGFFGIYYQLNDHFIFNLRSKNSLVPIRDFDNFDQNVGILNKLFNRGWYNVDVNFSIRYQFGNKSVD